MAVMTFTDISQDWCNAVYSDAADWCCLCRGIQISGVHMEYEWLTTDSQIAFVHGVLSD